MAIAATASPQSNPPSSNEQKSDQTPVASVAHVKPATGYFATDIGQDGFRVGDSVVFVNQTDFGPILTAKGTIDAVSESGSYGKFAGVWTTKDADVQSSEIYVISRIDSPCSLARARFGWPHRQAATLPDSDPNAVAYDDKTGKPAGGTVLDTSSEAVIADGGSASFRAGDIAVGVRFSVVGPLLIGIIEIQRVYRTDLEGYVSHSWGGARPEDGVYVISRASSRASLARVRFRAPKQYPVVHD
jgi:hypothetical protein